MAHDALPVKPTRKSNAGNQPGHTRLAAEKFGVDRATVKRALAEAKSEPAKPPEPLSQAPALQAAFIAAAERYRDAEHAMKHLTRLWQSSSPEEREALAAYPPDRI